MAVNQYESCFIEAGAIVNGHFVFTSGRHSGVYVNKRDALARASHARIFSARIAHWISERFPETRVIVGPESGAVTLMADVRTALWIKLQGPEIYGIPAQKTLDGTFVIGNGQERFVAGENVVIVEDIMTTGASAKKTVEAVREARGIPLAVACLWNRGEVAAPQLDVKRVLSLIEKEVPDYLAAECPLCKSGVPINTDLGHGAEYLKKLAH